MCGKILVVSKPLFKGRQTFSPAADEGTVVGAETGYVSGIWSVAAEHSHQNSKT